MMENPAETGVLSGDSFSHQYEVNSNEKAYSEGTTGKVETSGEMEKTSGETRDADGGVVEGEDSLNSAGIDAKVMTEAGNGHGGGIVHVDDDVVMADVEAEGGFVGGGVDVKEECIGNGGMMDQAQPAVVENGKQNGRPCDPFASPDDQPMPQAESPATQNIYDLQSSWPQQHQSHTGYEDPQQQPDEHLNQEEIIPTEVISEEQDEQRGLEYPNETVDYIHSEQHLEEDEVKKVEEAISGDYLEQYDIEKEEDTPQEHLDPYEAAGVDHSEQKDSEKEKETPQEYLDPYEAAGVDHSEEIYTEKEKETPQEYLDPYEAAGADHSEEKYTEKEKETPQEYLDTYEAAGVDHSEEKYTEKEKETPQEYLDPYAAAEVDHSEQKHSEKEKETPQEYLDTYEAAGVDHSEEKYTEKEKETPQEYLDPYAAAEVDHSEQKHSEKEKETPQEYLDSYESAGADHSEDKYTEKEKETPQEYLDPYDVASEDADQQLTTEIQQDPVQNIGDPYTSAEVVLGLDEEEKVHESEEDYQEYAQEIKEPAPTTEPEIILGQEDLQKSEEIPQEYPSENIESTERVQGEKEEDIAQPSVEEHPIQSMEVEEDIDVTCKEMEQMLEGDIQSTQDSVSLTEAAFMQTPLQTEEQSEKEDHKLLHQDHTQQEQLLDPYAPENADMNETRDTFHSRDSEQFGDPVQQGQQDSIPPDYTDISMIGADFGAKKTETEFAASAPFEDDHQQLYEGDHEVAQTLDDQVESGNMEAERPLDPIDAVFKANSEENLLGLDPEAAVYEKEQDEKDLENLEPVLESEQNVMSSHLLENTDVATPPYDEAQPEVVHDPMHAPAYDREDVHIDLSHDQDTVVSSEVNTESFQSVIQSSDPLVSQGLSQVDIEPSQQGVEDISTHATPIQAQESDYYDDVECQEKREEPDRNEVELEEEEAMKPTSQGKAPSLPLLDLGDGPVQILSMAESDQSPGQRSFEGSFSPIEDNVAVSLALEDQGGVMESGEQEESDDDAHTETTEVEADLKEDNFEQQIQHEEESAYNIPKEVPTEDTSHEEDLHEEIVDERKDISEAYQSEFADTNIEESAFGHVEAKADISPEIPDTMQIDVETCLPESEKADDEYNQIHQQLSEDLIDGVDVNIHDQKEDFYAAATAAEPSEEVSTELHEHVTPDIVMQEYEEEEEEQEEAGTEQTSYTIPDVSTDTTLQNTADKLLGKSEETDAIIMERVGASATPPNTPDVISSSPPDIASNPLQASMQETMHKEGQSVEDQLAPEAEQFASYDSLRAQSEEKQESSTEDPIKPKAEEVLESAPEEPPCAPTTCDEKPPSPQISTPSVPLPTNTPEAKSAHDEAKEEKVKSSPAQQKKPKTPTTGIKSPSKKSSPSAAQNVKMSEKSKASDIPKKTAALSRSLPKPTAPVDRKEAVKAPSKSPAKTPSKTPAKVSAKVPTKTPTKGPTKVPAKTPAKAPAKTPAKASPKVPAPATRLSASAKKTTGPASAGTTPARSRTAPPKVDTKPSESKPKQDKVNMSGVKQKTVTTVTKTTHTEVRSAKSSPKKSADGDSPRVRNSPGRNGVPASKIGSLDNSRHSPGGGNVRIQSEKSNYSKVQSRCGSLGNATHKAGGGNVKIFDERVDFRTRANSRVGSLDNAHHAPGGGNVKILHDPVTFSKSASRVGSMENAHHSPHGGKVKILHDPVSFPKSSVSSKVGSLDNAQHSPGGGNVKIASASLDFSKKAKSKVGSLDNAHHSPRGGNVKILSQSADFSKTAKSKIGSLDNSTHSPGGGKIKIENKKVDYSKKVTSKIGSLDNSTHRPGGGRVKIENKKLDFKGKAASKIGSKDNIKHQAGGGQVKIENKKLDFKEKAASKVGSKDNIEHKPGGGSVKIQEEKLEFKMKASSKVGSLDNANHKPGGGDVQIQDEKLEFSAKAHSKVGSMDNADHQPSGGDVKIQDEKLEFSARAHSKVGSMDNADHQPSGGDVKIFDGEKPTFQHVSPRTDDGIH